MKTLYILRHGKAVSDEEAATDHARDLTGRGRRDAARAGAELTRRGSRLPSLVVASTALRAKHTAELCVRELANAPPIELTDELYLASAERYLTELAARGADHEAVMLVGHNPGLEALVARLTAYSEHLPTAALVEVELPIEAWTGAAQLPPRAGRLVQVWEP